MKYKFIISIILLIAAFTLNAADKNIEDFLKKYKNSVWNITPINCSEALGVKVSAQDNSGNVMRYSSKGSLNYVRFKNNVVPEVIFSFNRKKLQSVTISIYNRGDSARITEKEFKKLNSEVERLMYSLSGDKKPVIEIRKLDKSRIESIMWRSNISDYVLRRNLRGKYPEYIQIILYPAGQARRLRDALRSNSDKNQLQLNLQISQNGDNYLNIPMVNQGMKGYCVGATVERIMKYYGSRIDQQIIAQLAESDAYNGTNIRKIVSVLDKNKSKLKIDVDKVVINDILTFEDLQSLTMRYNNFAKKQKRKRINFNDFCSRKGRYKRVDVAALISNYEYDIFCSACNRNKRKKEKFIEEVHKSLNKGIPLAWVTFVFSNTKSGQPVENFGFHMRIINGFNEKTNQIIYTDSWGRGHEKKYMYVDDAWAHTLMLLQITPK